MICPNHKNREIVPGKTQCQLCLDKMKLRYQKNLQSGMCVHHPNSRAVPGKQDCSECRINRRVRRLRNIGLSEFECAKTETALRNFDGKCWSCGAEKHGGKDWHLDHDDTAKKFRGILCSGCNLSIGHSGDDPAKLRAAAKYLETQGLRKDLTN